MGERGAGLGVPPRVAPLSRAGHRRLPRPAERGYRTRGRVSNVGSMGVGRGLAVAGHVRASHAGAACPAWPCRGPFVVAVEEWRPGGAAWRQSREAIGQGGSAAGPARRDRESRGVSASARAGGTRPRAKRSASAESGAPLSGAGVDPRSPGPQRGREAAPGARPRAWRSPRGDGRRHGKPARRNKRRATEGTARGSGRPSRQTLGGVGWRTWAPGGLRTEAVALRSCAWRSPRWLAQGPSTCGSRSALVRVGQVDGSRGWGPPGITGRICHALFPGPVTRSGNPFRFHRGAAPACRDSLPPQSAPMGRRAGREAGRPHRPGRQTLAGGRAAKRTGPHWPGREALAAF
jgi:hypothetical protein